MQKIEKNILIAIFTVFLFSIMIDLNILNNIPDILVLKVVDYFSFFMVLFQIQATISTLCIALISIVSGVSNETIYGISIAGYILQIKPIFLKHKTIITILLLLVLASYVFISFGMYNSIIAALFVTILMILYMSSEIFNVFQGREHLKSEITKYVEKNSSDINVLDILVNDILNSIDRFESLKYKENMDLLIKIFKKSASNYLDDEDLKIKWQSSLKVIFENSFSQLRTSSLTMAYHYFDSVYEIISKEIKKENEFVLWDEVANDFFGGLKWFNVEVIEDLEVFHSVRWHLYQCLNHYIENGKTNRNNISMELILIRVYYNFLIDSSKALNFTKQELFKQKKRYFDYISNDLSYRTNTEIMPVILKELRLYTKVLIDNQEIDIIVKTFSRELNDSIISPNINEEQKAYHLSIIIYLYYLAYKEVLVSEELKASALNILSQLQHEIIDYLLTLSFQGPLEKSLVKTIRSNLDWWEIFPEDDAKTLVMESVIDTFLLFYVLYSEMDLAQFQESILSIIGSNVFSYVNDYTGARKINAINKYEEFVMIFFNKDLDQEDLVSAFNRLENVLFEIYKSNEELAVEIFTTEKINELEKVMMNEISDNLIPKFEALERFVSEDISEERLYRLTISTSTRFLQSNLTDLGERTYNHFLIHIVNLIINQNNITRKDVDMRDKKALALFFDIIESKKMNINTLIGYKDWYYGYEKEDEFRQLEAKSDKIRSSRTSNIIVGIDKENISINSINCEVKIRDVNFRKIIEELKKDENGKLLYNVTNDIYMPFDESELERYLQTTLREIHVVINYKFQFDQNGTGIAIVFQPKKYFEKIDDENI